MKKFFLSSPFLIALLLGGYSSYLAYKGEYEAAMAGAGVSVALATSRRDSENEGERRRLLNSEIESYRLEMERINRELEIANHLRDKEAALANERRDFDAIIKEKEVEIAILKTQNQMLLQQQEVRYLPESETSFVNIEPAEKQIAENFEENDD